MTEIGKEDPSEVYRVHMGMAVGAMLMVETIVRDIAP